jgi:glycerol-3-phosphate dehydrogenase subunit C
LFIDTFTQNFEPDNAKAAIAVLEAGGYHVVTAQADVTDDDPLCCGRTALAHGLVGKAKEQAKRVLKVLYPYVKAGIPVIGLEPACLLAIRDDYRFLGLGDMADKVAANAILFEEFIAKEHSAKRLNLNLGPLRNNSGSTLVHGHCHQKAVGAMKSMRKVLKLIPDLQFELIDSSCCGMAGSFGLEAEHAESSLAMAELSLLPSIRNQPEADLVANGFSCRHQIREHTGRSPMHIATLLYKALSPT